MLEAPMPHMPCPVLLQTQTILSRNHLLAYPCPKYTHWSRNWLGFTQHLNVVHQTISPDPVNDAQGQINGDGGEYEQDIDLLLHPPSSSPMAHSSPPLPVVHAEFIGPENKLFRNYHPLLTGKHTVSQQL